jgi:hypothetical protein
MLPPLVSGRTGPKFSREKVFSRGMENLRLKVSFEPSIVQEKMNNGRILGLARLNEVDRMPNAALSWSESIGLWTLDRAVFQSA